MKYTLSLMAIGILMLILSCKPNEKDPNATIEILDHFSEIEEIINTKDHEVTVLNFWSTACPPCIKELPHFNRLKAAYTDKKVKILLVSLEDANRLDTHMYPFVKKWGIQPEVVILDDQNYNIWTDKIDTSWYGALPATLILKGDKRKFRFGSYATYEELKADVDGILME